MVRRVMKRRCSIEAIFGARPNATADLLAVIAFGMRAIRTNVAIKGWINLTTALTASPPAVDGENSRAMHIL